MGKVLAFLMAAGAIVGIVLGIYWLIWSLWCWVLPQLWAEGPENVVRPGFWLFTAAALLVSWLGRSVFGGSKK